MLIEYVGSLSYLMLLLTPLLPLSAYRLNQVVHLLIAEHTGWNLMEGRGCLSNKTNGYTVLAAQLVHILDICRFGNVFFKCNACPTVVRDLPLHTCMKTESVIAEPSRGSGAATSFSKAVRPHSTTSHTFWNNSVLDFCAQGNSHIIQKKKKVTHRKAGNTSPTHSIQTQLPSHTDAVSTFTYLSERERIWIGVTVRS